MLGVMTVESPYGGSIGLRSSATIHTILGLNLSWLTGSKSIIFLSSELDGSIQEGNMKTGINIDNMVDLIIFIKNIRILFKNNRQNSLKQVKLNFHLQFDYYR
jgi:hypothetical protein